MIRHAFAIFQRYFITHTADDHSMDTALVRFR
jgi:hypothetical protein